MRIRLEETARNAIEGSGGPCHDRRWRKAKQHYRRRSKRERRHLDAEPEARTSPGKMVGEHPRQIDCTEREGMMPGHGSGPGIAHGERILRHRELRCPRQIGVVDGDNCRRSSQDQPVLAPSKDQTAHGRPGSRRRPPRERPKATICSVYPFAGCRILSDRDKAYMSLNEASWGFIEGSVQGTPDSRCRRNPA